MKRKRGSKKGHKKGKRNDAIEVNVPASATVSTSAEDTNCLDHHDDSQNDSEMDAEPSTVGSGKPGNISHVEADQANDNSIGKAGTARLKVKLRNSKAIDPHKSYSDIQTPSDTDKSNQQIALELNNAAVEKDDSTYSDGQTMEIQKNIPEIVPKKAGSIKIKSSKALGLSTESVHSKISNRPTCPPTIPSERDLVISDDEKSPDILLSKSSQRVDIKRSYRDPSYSEKELNASITVIKKVMKMDAAEPFNAPVDPVALGIPDYFDIINTPMDFGTILHDLEHGDKYMNSEDVFKDVQLIWENCYTYNNKGDYVVDLMKRVKKNFMKYWMAAGLYLDKLTTGTAERTHNEDGTRPSQDKLYSKGKQKHKRRKHGIDLHKSDCLCAVCVVRRRRKEREKNSPVVEKQMKTSNAEVFTEFNMEGNSPANQDCSEDGTSSRDHSEEDDANADFEEVMKETKMETPKQRDLQELTKLDPMNDGLGPHVQASGSRQASLNLLPGNGDQEDSSRQSQEQDLDLSIVIEIADQKDVADHQQDTDGERIHEESAVKSLQHAVAQETFEMQENHSVLQICKSLFPSNVKSVWTGPHSLMRRHVPSTRDTPIHSALAAFMNS